MFLPEIAQLFYILRFRRPDPQGRDIAKDWFSRPSWPRAALGNERNSGPKMGKRNFPELGEGKSVRPNSFSQKLRNFLTLCVLADRPPRGGKSQNTGFLGPVGLGQPLALREIPVGKNRKTYFPN